MTPVTGAERCINVRYHPHDPSGPTLEFLPLTSAVLTGSVGTYSMAAQRRTSSGVPAAVVQIVEHATGRTVSLNLTAPSEGSKSAGTVANHVLGYVVTRVLHSKDTPLVRAAIENLFQFCWNGGPTRTDPVERDWEVKFAAAGVHPEQIEPWLDHPFWAAWLRGGGAYRAVALAGHAAHGVTAKALARFVRSYVERAAEVQNYGGSPTVCLGHGEGATVARYVQAGWTGRVAFDMAYRFSGQSAQRGRRQVRLRLDFLCEAPIPRGWLALPGEVVEDAIAAGLSAREALWLHQEGRLDGQVLRALAALNRDPEPVTA